LLMPKAYAAQFARGKKPGLPEIMTTDGIGWPSLTLSVARQHHNVVQINGKILAGWIIGRRAHSFCPFTANVQPSSASVGKTCSLNMALLTVFRAVIID
jgi:hypothetical protein